MSFAEFVAVLLQIESPIARSKQFRGLEKLVPKLDEAFALYKRDGKAFSDPLEIGEFVLHLNGDSKKTKMIRRASILQGGFSESSTYAEFVKMMCMEKCGTLEKISNTIEAMREAFDLFDGDKDGEITFQEFTKVLCALGKPDDGTLMEEARLADTDHSGLIDFREFVAVMTKQDIAKSGSLHSCIAKYKKMFLLFDNNETGRVVKSHLGQVMRSLGLKPIITVYGHITLDSTPY